MKTLLTVLIIAAVMCWPVEADGCCEGPMRGDANLDGNVDIADVIAIQEWMFEYGDPPKCMEEADANASGGNADISDLLYLIDYIFHEGPTPQGC